MSLVSAVAHSKVLHPNPWERQQREPMTAYHAFCVYRNLGPTRTITRTAAEILKSESYLSRLSVQWNWRERAMAWDDHKDTLVRAAEISESIEAGKRQARVAQKAIELSEKALDALIETPEKISPRDAAQLLDIGTKVERRALGMDESARPDDNMTGTRSLMESILANPELVAIMDTVGSMLLSPKPQQNIIEATYEPVTVNGESRGETRDIEPAGGDARAVRDPGEPRRIPDGWSLVTSATPSDDLDLAGRPGDEADQPLGDLDAAETREE